MCVCVCFFLWGGGGGLGGVWDVWGGLLSEPLRGCSGLLGYYRVSDFGISGPCGLEAV